MNKSTCLLIKLLFLLISINCYADIFYYYSNEKIKLQKVPNKYYLQTITDIDVSEINYINDVIIKSQHIIIPASIELFNNNKIKFGYWSLIVSEADIKLLEEIESVGYIAPVFLTEYKKEVILSNFITIKLKKNNDVAILKQLADKYLIEVVGNLKSMPLWYVLSCSKKSLGSALQMANTLHETGLFAVVSPDLMSDNNMANSSGVCVNDEYFGDQWNLKIQDNTEQII